ncbi:hypothetical protein [Saccharothrix sp. ST-888]|uniref:hypothetical protein n=1 Tax=Saccharothrix sp. ST-888 TaxID=1427391 RepID=UPI0005EC2904|nr:hypothetical protein [Saccharothrix sp. ST-888]KJK56779.1 hypothetical protein UK12_20750 [Saccharothrix sp. ST-888]
MTASSANDSGREFTTDNPDAPHTVTYLLTHLAFAGITALEIAVPATGMATHSWRERRTAAIGLSLVALGGASCVAYAVSEGGHLIAFQPSYPWGLEPEEAISSLLAGHHILAVATRLCITLAGSRRAAVYR